jgi:cobalt-precorrin-5B (C1)-methyltransferase
VQVELSIPEGLAIARKTLNSRVGVKGGISVLGTTGLVEPWDDHLEETIRERVSSTRNAVLTTGRIGLRYARLMFPDHEVVLVGGKIREALDAAKGGVILFGLPALILHYINPHILEGTGYATVEEFSGSPAFLPAMRSSLAAFKKEYPDIRIVLVNREGAILGKSP